MEYNLGYKIRQIYHGIKLGSDIDRIGVINEVSNGNPKYHIKWNDGEIGWYSESSIEDMERNTRKILK